MPVESLLLICRKDDQHNSHDRKSKLILKILTSSEVLMSRSPNKSLTLDQRMTFNLN